MVAVAGSGGAAVVAFLSESVKATMEFCIKRHPMLALRMSFYYALANAAIR